MGIPATYHIARDWGYSRLKALCLALTLGRRLCRNDPPRDTWGRLLADRAARARAASGPD